MSQLVERMSRAIMLVMQGNDFGCNKEGGGFVCTTAQIELLGMKCNEAARAVVACLPSADNIIRLSTTTKLNLDPDTVIEAATGSLSEVLVLGWKRSDDGNGAFYFAASDADLSRALMLILRAQKYIMETVE